MFVEMSPKKFKLEPTSDSSFDEVADSLKACTSNQLITIIAKLLSKRPELETVSMVSSNIILYKII